MLPPLKSVDDDSDEDDEDDEDVVQKLSDEIMTVHPQYPTTPSSVKASTTTTYVDIPRSQTRRPPPSPIASPPSLHIASPSSAPTASSHKIIPRTRTKNHVFTTQDDSDVDDRKCDSDYCPSEGDADDEEDDGDYCTSDDDEFVDEADDEVDGDDDSDENQKKELNKELTKKLEKVGFQSYLSSTLGGSKSESAIKTACNRIIR
jgi:hypothetical protein